MARIEATGKRAGDRDLVRLVYASAAAPGLTDADILAIAERSAARNLAAGLTGLLMHQANGFYAVLEGPSRRLFACMERVVIDPRHQRLEVLLETAIDERRFESWNFSDLPVLGARSQRFPVADEFIRTLCRRLK